MNESGKSDGNALSPSACDGSARRRSRGHRYKFCFVVPAYAGKRNADGERSPQGVITLARCLDSIAQQTDPDCMVIVVNDGNSVEMRDLVQQFQMNMPHIPVTYYQAPYRGERGGHESVNLALSVLPENVDFVAIVNADNTLRSDYIEKMYQPEFDIVTCQVRMNDIPGITLNGRSFSRRQIDRLNYAIRSGIARMVKHKMHMDSDCDYVIDCLAIAENGVYHVDNELAEHN